MRFTLVAACTLFVTLVAAAPTRPDSSVGMKTDGGIIIRKSAGFEPHRITLSARRHEDGVAGDEEGGEDGQEVEEDEEKDRAASRGGSQTHVTFFQPLIQSTANPTINTVGQTGDGVISGQGGRRVNEGVMSPEEA